MGCKRRPRVAGMLLAGPARRQHRRTHQNGRTSSKATGDGQAKRQKTSQSKRSAASDQQQVMSIQPSMSSLDPSLPQSPASSFGFPDSAFPQQTYPPLEMNSPFTHNTSYSMSGPYDPALGAMNGLDTLAAVASKRDSDF